jgi:putative membrane protein
LEEMLGYMDSLKNAAAACLEKTAALKREPFEVGAATILPKEYDVGEGMGDGGITVTIVKVGKQKTAYVVVDGNNMISGLREESLSALSTFGIDAGEVYTTDTHSVNAVILGRRGYHPVGEAIDHKKLIGYIKEATLSALSKLEQVKAGCQSITVPKAKVIGREKLEMLSILIDKGLQKAKRSVAPVFALTGLLLMLFLLLV